MAPLTNVQLVEKLKALGVELKGDEKRADLVNLLAKYDEPKEEAEHTDVAVEPQPEDDNDDIDEITIEYHNPQVGLTDRTFTRAIHGKDFKKVAAIFAESHNGTVK